MRDQISFYLERARAAARGASIGTSTQIEPCLEGLLRTFRKIYAAREIQFSETTTKNLRFLGERQDLEEMIGNLLDNAGKWAQGEVKIEITPFKPENETSRLLLQIIIDDDGPGLSPNQREQATQRGQRLDESKPGSGLGLSIVADLAAAYGGGLKLDDSPSGGLRATLLLPGF